MGDKESRYMDAKLDEAIERGEICQSCGVNLSNPYKKAPTDCIDCYDPTPYCSGCKAMSPRDCDCGPIADND